MYEDSTQKNLGDPASPTLASFGGGHTGEDPQANQVEGNGMAKFNLLLSN